MTYDPCNLISFADTYEVASGQMCKVDISNNLYLKCEVSSDPLHSRLWYFVIEEWVRCSPTGFTYRKEYWHNLHTAKKFGLLLDKLSNDRYTSYKMLVALGLLSSCTK